jgi:predicted xylose isomerase-like sugar epimerase
MPNGLSVRLQPKSTRTACHVKVAVVQPVTEGFGFNITTETNVQLVSFAYATRAEAEAAATHAQAVVAKAVSVLPVFNPQPRRRWWAVLLDLWNR